MITFNVNKLNSSNKILLKIIYPKLNDIPWDNIKIQYKPIPLSTNRLIVLLKFFKYINFSKQSSFIYKSATFFTKDEALPLAIDKFDNVSNGRSTISSPVEEIL